MTEEIRKIDKKIVGYRVKTEETIATETESTIEVKQFELPETTKGINESVNRNLSLDGRTYKLKPSNSEFSYYVTINHQEIDGKIYPFEIFINSKCVEHLEWITTITRTISAVFRKGGDTTFLIDELKAVHSANGGYWGKDYFNVGKRKHYPSLIAELGYVLEYHFEWLDSLGISLAPTIIAESVLTVSGTSEFNGEYTVTAVETINYAEEVPLLPQCKKCKEHALVLMDGCLTCSACGDSKCG